MILADWAPNLVPLYIVALRKVLHIAETVMYNLE